MLKLIGGAKICTPTYPKRLNRSEVIESTNKQTKRFWWKHPPRSAVLRRWKKISKTADGHDSPFALLSLPKLVIKQQI